MPAPRIRQPRCATLTPWPRSIWSSPLRCSFCARDWSVPGADRQMEDWRTRRARACFHNSHCSRRALAVRHALNPALQVAPMAPAITSLRTSPSPLRPPLPACLHGRYKIASVGWPWCSRADRVRGRHARPLHAAQNRTPNALRRNRRQAAADSAKAALLFAENQARADRPWILITADPTPGVTDSFTVVATNRGRSPARIVSLADDIAIVRDEAQLPSVPVFKAEPAPRSRPSSCCPANLRASSPSIATKSTRSARSLSRMQRVEDWDEKIYLYGNVT